MLHSMGFLWWATRNIQPLTNKKYIVLDRRWSGDLGVFSCTGVVRVPVGRIQDTDGHSSRAMDTQTNSRIQLGGAIFIKLRLHELHTDTDWQTNK